MTFLMGMNESYSQVRGQILLMYPIPIINQIFSLVIQKETQREIGNTKSITTLIAFNVQSNNNTSYNSKIDHPITHIPRILTRVLQCVIIASNLNIKLINVKSYTGLLRDIIFIKLLIQGTLVLILFLLQMNQILVIYQALQ